jgi:autoinducer 2-degrading protein
MSGFVVTVEFRVKPGALDGFLGLVTENARLSVRTEPGCRQFDVVVPRGSNNSVFLFEIYDDEAAFESHKTTVHFGEFERQSGTLVVTKNVTVGHLHFASRSQ